MNIQIIILKLLGNKKKLIIFKERENVWFCGAYLGYGFHEDGISSSMHVAKRIYEFEKKIQCTLKKICYFLEL